MKKLANSGSRPLVQWLHSSNPYLVDDLTPDGPIGAIAVSAVDAARLDGAVANAGERGCGAVVDSEAYRVQLDPEHPLRAAYRDAGLEWLKGVFDPAKMALTSEGRSELVSLHRDAQAAGGATIFLSPAHLVADSAPLNQARRRELAIQEDFVAIARASGAGHPAPQSPARRKIAVGLAVNGPDLRPRVSGELASAYRDLDADLFWLSVWNFRSTRVQYEAVRYLARTLQRESGRPCLVAGIGALWEGALRNQIAAACQGWGRGTLRYPPIPRPAPPETEERGAAYGIPAFHPAIRGSVPLGDGYGEASALLYRRHPCPCDYHAAAVPPEGQRERHLHNRFWAERLCAGAIAGDPDVTTASLASVIEAAVQIRAELKLGPLPAAWRLAAAAPADGERIDVPAELWLPRAA